jgi:hypothetical protein
VLYKQGLTKRFVFYVPQIEGNGGGFSFFSFGEGGVGGGGSFAIFFQSYILTFGQ